MRMIHRVQMITLAIMVFMLAMALTARSNPLSQPDANCYIINGGHADTERTIDGVTTGLLHTNL